MIGITAALLLQSTIIGADANSYATAHRRVAETGEPLVVLVGADWCPACQTMKHSVIPQARRSGLLKRVAFAVVNTDHEPALARQLMRGSAIPQLVIYRKTDDGWRRRQLTGVQSLEELRGALAESAPAAQDSKLSERQSNESAVDG